MLKRYGVRLVVDVRRKPGSRCCPWFRRSVLERLLPNYGIGYFWLGDLLGGLDVDYPSYVETEAYRRGIAILATLALQLPTAIMCRERYWLRCHRAFIADTLYAMGFSVIHVLDLGIHEKHKPLGVAPSWVARINIRTLL